MRQTPHGSKNATGGVNFRRRLPLKRGQFCTPVYRLAAYAYEQGDDDDLLAISVKLAETPCSPLYNGPVSPDRALHELVKARAQT
jgi:hypothetical protein